MVSNDDNAVGVTLILDWGQFLSSRPMFQIRPYGEVPGLQPPCPWRQGDRLGICHSVGLSRRLYIMRLHYSAA